MRYNIFTIIAAICCMACHAQEQDLSQYMPKLPAGTLAPAIAMPTPEGTDTLRLSDYRGKYVVVDFWASWCGDCRREMPIIQEAIGRFNDVDVLSVSFDIKPEALNRYLTEHPNGWPTVCDYGKWKESPVAQAYQLKWIPTFYIVDPDGIIVGSGITGEQMSQELERLLGKRNQ